MTGARRGAAALVVVLSAVGCGNDSPAAGPSSASEASATTGPTASRAPTTSASPSAVPVAGSKDFGFFPEVVSASPAVLSFDRAVFLTGEEAVAAAEAHGDEAFDYYVVNDNPLLRTVRLAPDCVVVGSLQLNDYTGEAVVEPKEHTVAELVAFLGTKPGTHVSWHLTYGSGGAVSEVEEQYEP